MNNQEGTEFMTTSQVVAINDDQEETELMVTSQVVAIDDNQEGTELMTTSQMEVIDEFQEGPEPVASHEESCLTDGLAKVTSMITDVSVSNSPPGTTSEIPVEFLAKDGNPTQVPVSGGREGTTSEIPVELLGKDGNPTQVPVSGGRVGTTSEIPVEVLGKDGNPTPAPVSGGREGTTSETPIELLGKDGNPTQVSVSGGREGTTSEIPIEILGKDGNPSQVPVNGGREGTISETPIELLGKDGNPTQVPVRGGRKKKWKDMARGKPGSLASPAPDDTQAIQSTVNGKSEPRRGLPEFSPTHSAASTAIDAIQQISFPHSYPNVHNNLQSQISTSLAHGSSPSISVPAISAHLQQLPQAQVSSLRFYELLQGTNSVSDCDTHFELPGVVHCVFPPSASASVQAPPTQTGEEFSIGARTVGEVGHPRGRRSRLESELPPVSSGKPPRPRSSTHSRGLKRSQPSENGRQAPGYRIQHPHESNHVHPHGLNLPHACRQPLPSATHQFNGPSSLSISESDPPDDTELPSTLNKRKKSNLGESPQQKRRNKRRLEQLRTQVITKLKLWGRKSKLLQEADGAGQNSKDWKRLMLDEKQRDVLVKNMVESCRKDPQIREAFLASVKQLANIGVLHASARLLVDQDPSGRSQDVFNAWKEMHLQSAGNSSAAVNLYKAVDELHSQGEVAMRKLPPVDGTSMCSFSKTSEGPWELVFPDIGTRNRITKRNEDGLDEPLRPSKSRT